ncbi:transcriptional regulator, TetR family [Natronincola peptidivorans]|uniref:Transcriptional regulator, TetR family n=1 Tax=Natronincola peptidivorans TaxID=426128 RepID=A0A1I0HBK7_9FIRM|nr:TetR/AcrR family transcriptional regulator [Natronincola peptidivorans]SET80222.1 transcriptional regulator, TetR family [Natronincola peptidivorans]
MEKKQNMKNIKALETKGKICESAYSLFKEKGFDGVSIDSIVEKAGVAKGSFYVHFESKNAVIAAFIAEYVNKVDLDYKAYVESFPDDTKASDILIALAGKTADVITNDIGYDNMRTVYEILIANTEKANALLSYNRELYMTIHSIVSKGVKQGEFRADLSAENIAKHFLFALRGFTYEWCIRHPDFNLKETAIEHIQIILWGIKKQIL